MRFSKLRVVLPLALLAGLTGCGREKDEKARNALHDAGFAYSVDDFLRAAREGKEGVVREFLKAGMNPDVTDERGVTAIAGAATRAAPDRTAKPAAAPSAGRTKAPKLGKAVRIIERFSSRLRRNLAPAAPKQDNVIGENSPVWQPCASAMAQPVNRD